MSRANTDLLQVNQVLVILPLTIASIFILAGVAAVMVSKSVLLAVLALGSLPLLNFAAQRFSHRMDPVTFELQRKLGDLSGVVEESIAGIRAIKGFGAERLQACLLYTSDAADE